MSAQIKEAPQLVGLRITAAMSAERRRASTIRDVASSLAALELTIRAKVPTLGNREAYVALRAAREKLDRELSRVEYLADEFLKMAQAEEAEDLERPDDAEDRWNAENNGGMP